MPGYDPHPIEKKWQQFWADQKVYASTFPTAKPKYYVLDMFPYPSGEGLHVGHPEGYTATDIIARYKRAKGFNVMHPMGWDAFGLPAEQYAIKTNTHPRDRTKQNIARFRQQLQAIGFSYDWDREVDTTDPTYYKWTQWIFLQLFDTWFDEVAQKGRPIGELIAEFQGGKRPLPAAATSTWDKLSPTEQRKILAQYRLAYQAQVPVNWCQGLGTVLSNEEVIDGKSEVGGFPVERRPMKQWMLRITAYAQRLLDGLDGLEWSDSLKEMQRHWLGRSAGAEVTFKVQGDGVGSITVFTTRPDTLFGATYMVIAPEHSLAASAPATHKPALEKYQKWAAGRSDRERQEDTRKTGEFTGLYAINPVNDTPIPIYVSDYVLMGYGTGAIMAVPAHDERDHEFATKFKLPIKQVVRAADNSAFNIQHSAFSEEGIACNSPWIDGLPTQEAKSKITAMLEPKGIGKKTINYKIRDWLFSRQRYWGEPFPLVHLADGTTVPIAVEQLPVNLPDLEDFKPTGTIDPPLSKAAGWVNVSVEGPGLKGAGSVRIVPPGRPGAVPARRELNTMPQWAGSCWYYLRYLDPHNDSAFIDPKVEQYWLKPAASGGAGHWATQPANPAQCSSKGPDGLWGGQQAGSETEVQTFTPGPTPPEAAGFSGAGLGSPNSGGVDLYVGGVEHAVLHLLYARFWHKVLFDRGLVSSSEPFRRLVNQGLILGEAEYTVFHDEKTGATVSLEHVNPEWDTRTIEVEGKTQLQTFSQDTRPGGNIVIGTRVEPEAVEKKGEHFVLKSDPAVRVDARSFKMSKSRGNVVNPDDVIRDYGADSLRMFEMFMGPLEQVKPWSTAGVEGVYRFLQRVWRNLFDVENNDALKTKPGAKDEGLERALHRLINKIGDDIERLSFNTGISAMMEFNNLLAKAPAIPQDIAERFVRVMEPFAPHFAEEVYHRMGAPESASVTQLPWPTFDPALLVDSTLDLPVQINGKLRGRVQVPATADEAAVFAATLAEPEIQKLLAGKEPKKKIYVKGRMVNLVV